MSVYKIDNMTANLFTLTTLSQNPEYFEEVIRLIEEEFHYSSQHSFEKDFAPLINPLNFENCFFYVDSATNTVVAHLAICIRTLVKNETEMKVALIGGIVTHKKYRGKDLFKNLITHAIHSYQKDVALFILWSDLESLYEKFEFYRTGGLVECGKRNLSSSERPSGYQKTKFPSLSDREFENINCLYTTFNEKHFFTIKRNDKDWSIIKDMSSIDLYVKKNSAGYIEKYFCINKGRDLTNIIHEISCQNAEDYASMVKELSCFKLWLPETEITKTSDKEVFYTAYMKTGNLTLLNNFLEKISQGDLQITKTENSNIYFKFQNKTYTATSKEFLQNIFGPNAIDEFAKYELSIYIPGVDSI
jgi:hypothetical protein